MKTRLTFLVILLFFISFEGLQAQPGLFGGSVVPLKPESPLFGKDIVINDQSTQDQQKVALCSAFNGWLYAVVTYKGGIWGNVATLSVLKSTDNGISWNTVIDGFYPGEGGFFSSIDILVTGDSISNLKIILALVVSESPARLVGDGYVNSYYEATGLFDNHLFQNSFVYDIKLASDFLYPASNSNPNSVGILYSQYANNGGNDSIVFLSSSNGGVSFDKYQGIAGTGNHYLKVALAYGRSPSWSSGRYFAAWEEQDNFGLIPGRIYTSHSNPDFNSPFTTPVRLDALDPSDNNLCMNPCIACQYNNIDNDSSNFTEVVLFDKYDPANLTYDITGYYNLQATNHTRFQKLTFTNPAHYNCQSSINFNPFDSTFMMTFYDSTTQKLPFLLNNFNLTNPNSWQWVTTGYNDDGNLSAPYPKVALNFGQQQGVNVWSKKGTNGNGVAMFDAPYSTWTGISGNSSMNSQSLRVYPNPCNSLLNIAFELKRPETVNITLYDQMGERIETVTDQSYSQGHNVITYNVSGLATGVYSLVFRGGNDVQTSKVVKLR